MGTNPIINSIFEDFQKNIQSTQELREKIRSVCHDIDSITRETTTVLQVIHHKTSEEGQACLKARELFEKARIKFDELKGIVPETDYYKYSDSWRYLTQRLSFLIALVVWLEKGVLVEQETVAQILGVESVERKVGFHLDIEDYLVGLLQMASELSRLAVNSVTLGDYERPLQISKFVMEINAGFRLLNLKNDFLRKRFDGLKYDVKKIEEVVYDLSIRGLIKRSADEEEKTVQ